MNRSALVVPLLACVTWQASANAQAERAGPPMRVGGYPAVRLAAPPADEGCGDPPSTALAVWLDARSVDGLDNSTLADNDPVATWVDLGSIGDDPVQATGAAQPTFIASCLNSKACVSFDGGDFVRATTAANFAFLNDGTDWTTYIVAKTDSANPNALIALVTTSTAAAASRGVFLAFDDRSGISRNNTEVIIISNGTSTNINDAAPNDTVVLGEWHAMAWRLDDDGSTGADSTVWADGTQIDTGTRGGSFSSSAPVAGLTIAAGATGSNVLTGDVAQVLIYQAAHNDAERGEVETWIECEYGEMPAS